MSNNQFSVEVDTILAALQDLADEFASDHDNADTPTLSALKSGKAIGVSEAMHTIRVLMAAREYHPAVWTQTDFDSAAEQAMSLARESNVVSITGAVIA